MTLLELMIAAGIMATAFVLLTGSMIRISATGASNEDRSIASAHMASVLEEISPLDRSRLVAYSPPTFRGLARETVTVTCTDTLGNLVAVPTTLASLTAPLPNPTEVRVTVRWRDPAGHPYRMSTTTLHRW